MINPTKSRISILNHAIVIVIVFVIHQQCGYAQSITSSDSFDTDNRNSNTENPTLNVDHIDRFNTGDTIEIRWSPRSSSYKIDDLSLHALYDNRKRKEIPNISIHKDDENEIVYFEFKVPTLPILAPDWARICVAAGRTEREKRRTWICSKQVPVERIKRDPKEFYLDQKRSRYKLIKFINNGSFGKVYKAIDSETGENVAVKFDMTTREPHELDILHKFSDTEIGAGSSSSSNIMCLKDSFEIRGYTAYVFPLADMTMLEFYNGYWDKHDKPIPLKLVEKLAIAMVKSLSYLKSKHVIHMDFKLENILVIADSADHLLDINQFFLSDFGAAQFKNEPVRQNVCTPRYASPERLLRYKPWTQAIDMWALGVSLFTLITGRRLFDDNRSLNLDDWIIQLADSVPFTSTYVNDRHLPRFLIESPRNMNSPHNFLYQLYRKEPQESSEDFILFHDIVDFIKRCLIWDPKRRLTIEQAQNHPLIVKNNRNFN